MKRLVLVGALVGAFAASTVHAQSATSSGNSLGTVNLTRKVLADGKPLAAGTYQVRLTSDAPTQMAGQTPGSEKFVEFMKGGKVVGRELATIISAEDIGKIVKGKKPARNSASVETLKGGDFVRVWINRGDSNYIINMPPA